MNGFCPGCGASVEWTEDKVHQELFVNCSSCGLSSTMSKPVEVSP
jgi:endogenous inhibitor of DNA gyrase (YacG/DUF329 family)